MIPIVEIPELVSHYSSAYEGLFSKAGFHHFQRYLSGLLICENKTVSRINQLFVLEPRDQSTLNRFLNRGRYEVESLNACRLAQLQSQARTAMKDNTFPMAQRGVLSIDNTLLGHVGEHFDCIQFLYDHVDRGYKLAHDLVNLYYADSEVDYPVSFELWRPHDATQIESGLRKLEIPIREEKVALKTSEPKKWLGYLLNLCSRKLQKQHEVAAFYRTKGVIARDLLQKFFRQYPELDLTITFDSWFCTPLLCRFIDQQLQRSYVASLRKDKVRLIREGRKQQKLNDFIESLKIAHLNGEAKLFKKTTYSLRHKNYTSYTYSGIHRLKNYGRVRLMINYQNEDLSDEPWAYISNKRTWNPATMNRLYRLRWPIESFHQEAKAEGLGKYQVRNFEAINRHIALVMIAFSMLTLARKDPEILKKLQLNPRQTDESLAFWRRLISAQTLVSLIMWAQEALANGTDCQQVIELIAKAYN